jgi:hypothetical protein
VALQASVRELEDRGVQHAKKAAVEILNSSKIKRRKEHGKPVHPQQLLLMVKKEERAGLPVHPLRLLMMVKMEERTERPVHPQLLLMTVTPQTLTRILT